MHDSEHKGIEASYDRERSECAKGRNFNFIGTTELPLEVSGNKDRRAIEYCAKPEGGRALDLQSRRFTRGPKVKLGINICLKRRRVCKIALHSKAQPWILLGSCNLVVALMCWFPTGLRSSLTAFGRG